MIADKDIIHREPNTNNHAFEDFMLARQSYFHISIIINAPPIRIIRPNIWFNIIIIK